MPLSFNLSALIASPIVQGSVLLPVLLILADLLSGVLAAWHQGTFDWSKAANFVRRDSDVLLYTVTAVFISGVTLIVNAFWGAEVAGIIGTVLGVPSVATLSGKLVASISSNISEMTSVPVAQVEQAVDQFLGYPAPPPTADTASMPAFQPGTMASVDSFQAPVGFGN